MIGHYLAALTASTPSEASAEAQSAQAAVDTAAALMDKLNAYSDEVTRVENTDFTDE